MSEEKFVMEGFGGYIGNDKVKGLPGGKSG